MKHATHCKFCKRPITLEVDDEYSKLGDPYKLLGLAACNHCVDVRVERRRIEEKVARCCRDISLLAIDDLKSREKLKAVLVILTKHYSEMVARWHFMEGSIWDEAIVNDMLDKPKKWPQYLGALWTMFRQWQEDQQQENKALL